MITEAQARTIALKKMPKGSEIKKVIPFENLYILLIIWPDELEGSLDPFFSVDKTTGYFVDFSIEDAGVEIIREFAQ